MTHQNESEQPTGPRGLRRLREKAGLDRAVVLTLFTRAWQAIAGAISLLLIAKFFPPETQGFYYTFSSLLGRLWCRASRLSFGFGLAGSLLVWGAVLILNELGVAFASRVLGPLPTALFLGAQALMQFSGFFAIYLRAHAREPFVFMGVSSCLLIGALVFVFGGRYGPTAAAAVFLAVVGLYVVPMSIAIWSRRRAEWQRA